MGHKNEKNCYVIYNVEMYKLFETGLRRKLVKHQYRKSVRHMYNMSLLIVYIDVWSNLHAFDANSNVVEDSLSIECHG